MVELSPNHWQFNLNPEPKRHQMVWLRVEERCENAEDWSRFVCTSAIAPAEGQDFERILRLNRTLDVGTVAIEDLKESEGGIRVPFLIFKASHLAKTADHEEIWELVTKTGSYADQLEKELSDQDIF